MCCPFIPSTPDTKGHLVAEMKASDWLSVIATRNKHHLLVVARYISAKSSHVRQFFRCLQAGNT